MVILLLPFCLFSDSGFKAVLTAVFTVSVGGCLRLAWPVILAVAAGWS